MSMGFSRQGYWRGLPFPSPGDLPNPGIEPGSPILLSDALPSEPPGKPWQAQGQVFNPGQRNNVCEKLCLHHPAGGVWAQNYHPTGGIWGQNASLVQTRGKLVAGHLPNRVWGNKGQKVRSPAVRTGHSEPGQAQGLGQEGRNWSF